MFGAPFSLTTPQGKIAFKQCGCETKAGNVKVPRANGSRLYDKTYVTKLPSATSILIKLFV